MENRAPLVSVIVATYRAGDYLRQTLASVLAQTQGDFEILVADDGHDEETRRVVEAFGDPRLFYGRNPFTLGPAGNHWAAMRRARGQYLAILNHDDLWKPDFLRQMLLGFDADPRVVVAFCDHDIIDPQGAVVEEETLALSRRTGRATLAPGLHRPFPDLAATCAIPTAQAAVFKRTALDFAALPEEAGPAYDLWLNYLLARTGGGAYYFPKMLASWRTHPASISTAPARSDWPAGAGAGWARMASDPLFVAQRRSVARRAAGCLASAALAALAGGRTAEARLHAWQALRQAPFWPRILVTFALVLSPPFLQKIALKK